ncbi:MAG: MgtC/SapB family protein [Gemmatimonadales bacterium]|nr:MgtC/SapB family protein [Gemmatimonadales bacterium]
MITSDAVFGLVAAALGGTAVGFERQWSGHADGPDAHFAGIRTFTMLGFLGGLSGWLWLEGAAVLAGILLAGVVAFTVGAYIAASRRDIDGTTEAAALIVIAAGILAGMGNAKVAAGIIAVLSVVLLEKSRVHTFVSRIEGAELKAGARFAVMALVILPLLPQGPFGPWGGIRPRELWLLVLFFTGLSFFGHLMRRAVGAHRGYLISGLAGGLVSSTNVTWTFARLSRTEPAFGRALALGIIGANAMLYPRVLAATTVLNPSLVPALLPLLAAPALLAAGVVAVAAWRSRPEESGASDTQQAQAVSRADRNPLQLANALQMALLFQAVLLIVHVAGNRFGQAGLLATAAVLGLTDVDALTISMARQAAPTVSIEMAALALAVGVLSNTALKTGLVILFGTTTVRLIAGGTLLAMIVAGAVAIWLRA